MYTDFPLYHSYMAHSLVSIIDASLKANFLSVLPFHHLKFLISARKHSEEQNQ